MNMMMLLFQVKWGTLNLNPNLNPKKKSDVFLSHSFSVSVNLLNNGGAAWSHSENPKEFISSSQHHFLFVASNTFHSPSFISRYFKFQIITMIIIIIVKFSQKLQNFLGLSMHAYGYE